MSSVKYLKRFVSDKLAAAAEEIFAVFHSTIVEYEKELDRHSKLMEMALKPEVKLRRIDLPRKCVFNEELVVDQDRTSKVDQEELEVPVIKEQQEELSIFDFRLKEEPRDLQIYFPDGETNRCGDTVVDCNPEVSGRELQQFSFHPAVCQSQELTGYECENSRSGRHKRKNTNSNFQKKQLDNYQNLTAPKPSTSAAGNRRRSKFKNQSKFLKNRKNRVDQTLDLSSRETVSQHKSIQIACNTPYDCQECGKTFSQCSKLKRHKMIHTYAERLHVCATCSKRFLTKSHLRDHEGIHTGEKPHVCQVCNKRFLMKNNLKKHMRIHTGERPHVCETCGKAFTQSSHLAQHVLVHKGKNRFSCKECGKSFPDSFSLTHHVASAHYDF